VFIDKILIFMIFLCPLIFFHELGHFLFARLFGVRVEVFSLGFGPKLFKKKWGDTEYALSLIPLGGYVKMFGDDPLQKDQIPEEERASSFTYQGKWARFWIVLGGPLANFIMSYVIFASLLMIGEKLPEIKFGMVKQGTVFYDIGIRSGDVIKKINDTEIVSPTDMAIDESGKINRLVLSRQDNPINLNVDITSKQLMDYFMKNPPILRKSLVVNKKGERFYLSSKESTVEPFLSIDQLADFTGVRNLYLFSAKSYDDDKKLELKTSISINYENQQDFYKALSELGYWPIDLVVKSINMNSPADKAGVKGNDIVVGLAGEEVFSFEVLRERLQKIEKFPVKLGLLREGSKVEVEVTPEIKEINNISTKLIGVYSSGEYLSPKFVHTASKGFFKSLWLGFPRTWDTIVKTLNGFKKLITNEVSLKNIGGPIAIGKVAADSFNTSLSYFFQIMALISVNLGIINLFPIPVLDGGHIMFIILEILNRGPLSRRKMEIAQQFGLSLLLLLTFAALFNDFSRLF